MASSLHAARDNPRLPSSAGGKQWIFVSQRELIYTRKETSRRDRFSPTCNYPISQAAALIAA